VFGPGSFGRLGELASGLGFRRTLLVADPGIVAAGLASRAAAALGRSGIEVSTFSAFGENPDESMVEAGARSAAAWAADSFVAVGGGSSLDCAKGVACVAANGGRMRDYWGYGKAARAPAPLIGVPTTAGSGSEAQTHCLIERQEDRRKMACGDPSFAFRIAILDPELVATATRGVRAVSGYDAISHAVESAVTTARNGVSRMYAREAFRLLAGAYDAMLAPQPAAAACADMLLGSHFAGAAVEVSMLGAAHACANPLTSRYGIAHGTAVSLTLPHVVRANAAATPSLYDDLWPGGARGLAQRLEQIAQDGGLPRRLRDAGVDGADLARLAREAAEQWTGRFNPRPFDAFFAEELYRCAW
jgi:alcohol dehydrogenase